MPRDPSTPPASAGSTRDDTSGERTPAEILKKIRALEIKTKGLVQSAFAGDYHSVFKGRGMNFEDVHTALDLEEGLAFLQQQLNVENDAGGG